MMLKKLLFLSLCGFNLPLPAQIILDGTLGPQLTLPGPNYQIEAKLGQQHGGNLFHSFSDFNLAVGESATFSFSGPDQINNVISRVTGGQASHLDGPLRSTIPGADVYLINPAGIFFGSKATLDISGSFHASSADVLRFEDGGTFNARQPENSVLSIAPVAAFGFLTDSPGALTVAGSHLSVPEQQSFSLLGGEIKINQAQLQAPFGRLNLASVAKEGEIGLEPTALKLTGTRGNISIRDSQIDLRGEGGGALDLQGGQIVMTESEIDATTQGTAAGRGVKIQADQLTMIGTYLFSDTAGSGSGGNIEIEAGSVNLEAGAMLTADTLGQGQGAKITLIATDKLLITGEHRNGRSSAIGVRVLGEATGAGGDIQIQAKQVVLERGGQISTTTSGIGNAGKLTLTATDTLWITGTTSNDKYPSGIVASVKSSVTSGAGGEVQIQAKQITLKGEGQINISTFGIGNAGKLTLTATDTLWITGAMNDSQYPCGILASVESGGSGTGGDIQIETKQLILEEKQGMISTRTKGPNRGGNLNLTTDTLLITSEGSIKAGSENGGPAGHITITANDNIRLQDAGSITTETNGAEGGNISITTAGLLYLTNQSRISTSVQAHEGNGGNITLQPLFLILDDSMILAQAIEGHGGDIKINTNDIYVFPSAQFPQADNQERLKRAIDASSQLGVSGTITVNSPDINVGKNLVVFATSMTDASSKLKKCVAKALSERSHFYIKRLPAKRLVLDDLRASRLLFVSTASPATQMANTQVIQSQPQVALLIGCRQELNQKSLVDVDPTQLF